MLTAEELVFIKQCAVQSLGLGPDIPLEESCREISHSSTGHNEVIQLAVDSPSGNIGVFAKVERSAPPGQSLFHEWTIITHAQKWFESQRPSLNCVEPIGWFEGPCRVLLLKECCGIALASKIQSACRWGAAKHKCDVALWGVETAGRWLHHLATQTEATQLSMEFQDELESLVNHATRRVHDLNTLGTVQPLLDTCRSRIEVSLDAVLSSKEAVRLAHGDFHPSNIMICPTRQITSVIDFQLARPQLNFYDALYFDLQLLLRYSRPTMRNSMLSALRAKFWDGFGGHPDPRCPIANCVKGQIALTSLVYLSLIARSGAFQKLRTLSARRDAKRIHAWLNA